MTTDNFEELFSSIVVPWARRRGGKKVLIGHNLSSRLLKKLIEGMCLKNQENIKAGFKACGIFPFDPQAVLKKLPADEAESSIVFWAKHTNTKEIYFRVSIVVPSADTTQIGKAKHLFQKKKRLSLEPGKSISEEEARKMIHKVKATKSKITKRKAENCDF